jgi:carboxyl-terminal processing protease
MTSSSRTHSVLISLCVVFLLPLGLQLPSAEAQTSGRHRGKSADVYEKLEIFGAIYQRILSNYVDELDAEELIDAAIEGMLEQLDPHSNLLVAEVYDDLMTRTQGEFGGLGIQITIRDDYPTVISPIDGTPASRMGIQGGDQIVEIEGESTKGWKSNDAVQKLRGPKGSQVSIGIQRVGRDKILPFTITRDTIHIESVPYSFILEDDIGYIKISDFSRTTADEIRQRISELEAAGMKKLVLDLRFNPGGLLTSAKQVSELFLERGDLIVYTKGRLAQQNMSYYATGTDGKRWEDRPLVALVNHSSASASEILAGAIQDHDVGVVLGQTSFGKGSVQTVFELSEEKALKLTTARYYTPSGRSIHLERDRDGEVLVDADGELVESGADDPEIKSAEIYFTDMGREVLGSGGISPDYEIKPTLLSDFAVAVERDATFFSFATDWLAYHPEPEQGFEVTQAMFDGFLVHAKERPGLPEFFADVEVEFDDASFEANRDYVEEGIRREITRRLWGSNSAFQVSIQEDGQVWEAVEILKQVETREELFKVTEERRRKKLAEAALEAPEQASVNN